MLDFVVVKSSLFSPIILPNDGSSVVSAGSSVVSSVVGLSVVVDVIVVGVLVFVLGDVIPSEGVVKIVRVPFPIISF